MRIFARYFLTSAQNTAIVLHTTLRRGERKYRKHLEKTMHAPETSADEIQKIAKKLCLCEGLAFAPDGTPLSHLCDAAASGNAWHVSLLLHAGAFLVDATDDNGFTALMSAAEFGHVECIQVLEMYINTHCLFGDTYIHTCICHDTYTHLERYI